MVYFDKVIHPFGAYKLDEHDLPEWYQSLGNSQESIISVAKSRTGSKYRVVVNDIVAIDNVDHFTATLIAIGIKESFQRSIILTFPRSEFDLNIDHPAACY